jgi:hypothetical protein
MEHDRELGSSTMTSPHVYDKAKYHAETVEAHGLPEEHASNHAVFFLRWLIEHALMAKWFIEETGGDFEQYRTGKASIHDLYDSCDCCLIDDMLSDEGNAFAMEYFDFEKGKYLDDYTGLLQGTLPSEYHIRYTEENYARMKEVIDRRYIEWKSKRSH